MEYEAKTDYDTAVFKDASDFISTMNERLKTRCAGCEFIDEDGFEFRCSRCKSAYYCSRKCQKKHWRSGHKFDCVTQRSHGKYFQLTRKKYESILVALVLFAFFLIKDTG